MSRKIKMFGQSGRSVEEIFGDFVLAQTGSKLPYASHFAPFHSAMLRHIRLSMSLRVSRHSFGYFFAA